MPSSIPYPLVNGHRFSWNSLELRFNGLLFVGVKSLNYKPSLQPGLVRGTSPLPIGRTKGEAEFTGDFEMLRLEWEQLLLSLGAPLRGFGEVSFPITAAYFEVGSPVVLDTVVGARVGEADVSNAQGTDASSVKASFGAMNIFLNGSGITSPVAFAV